MFHGQVAGLLATAQGKVWTFDLAGPASLGDLTVVSALNVGIGMRYRLVADQQPAPEAQPVEPNLEDGYVALMRRERTGAAAA